MQPEQNKHPSSEVLRSLQAGQLSAKESSELHEHLERCEACRNHWQALQHGVATTALHRKQEPTPRGDATVALTGEGGTNDPAAHDFSLAPPDNAAGSSANVVRFNGETIRYFGDYQLGPEIGRGGMGIVYSALQRSLNRPVAIKMISGRQLADSDEVRRFHSEAQLAANLDHPGIVHIYEVGEHEGWHFYSMELVVGENLAKRLSAGPLPAQAAAEILLAITRAVIYAHRQKIIHRDLKPSNILLDVKGQTKITDFGLAKQLDRDLDLTGTGDILGTPGFMSPEQARGDNQHVDKPADIYALGAILYNALTGRPPFQAATIFEALELIIKVEPVSPQTLQPSLPADINTICLKCLAKEPGQRYASAEALADDLQHFLRGEPIVARPLNALVRTYRWCRRHRLTASLLSAVAVSLIAGTIFSTYFAIQANQQAHRAQQKTDDANASAAQAQRETELARAAERETRMLAARTAYSEGTREHAANHFRNSQRALLTAWKLLGPDHPLEPSYRQTAWNAMTWAGRRLAYPPIRLQDQFYRLDIAQAANQLIVRDGQFGIAQVWDAATGQLQSRTDIGPRIGNVSLSPDEKTLIRSEQDTNVLRFLDLHNGQEQSPPLKFPERVNMLAMNRQRNLMALDVGTKNIQIWDLQTRKLVGEPLLTGYRTSNVQFDQQGKYLLANFVVEEKKQELGTTLPTVKYKYFTRVFEISAGKVVYETTPGENGSWSEAFSQTASSQLRSDGRELLTQSDNRTARVIDISQGKEIHQFQEEMPFRYLQYSPDSKLLICLTREHLGYGVRVPTSLSVRDTEKYQQKTLIRDQAPFESVTFTPDSQRILTTNLDNEIKLWDAATGKLLETPACFELGKTTQVEYQGKLLSVSPEKVGDLKMLTQERHLVLALSDSIQTWDLRPIPEHTLYLQSPTVSAAVVSDNEERLATVDNKGCLRIWNTAEEKPLVETADKLAVSYALAISPDGKFIASGDNIKTVHVWDTTNGKLAGPELVHENKVMKLRFTEQGKRLITGGIFTPARIWDITTGKVVAGPFPHKGVYSMDVSRDGTLLLIGTSENSLELRRLPEGKLLYPVIETIIPQDVAFSPDNEKFAAGGQDFAVSLRDVKTGKLLHPPMRHPHCIFSISFSPDGKRLASGCLDNYARLWDVATGQQLGEPMASKRGVMKLQFSADGQRLLTTDGDGNTLLWDGLTGAPLQHPMLESHNALKHVRFGAGGKTIYGIAGSTVQRWSDVPDCPSAADAAQVFQRWTGLDVNTRGETRQLTYDEWFKLVPLPEHAR